MEQRSRGTLRKETDQRTDPQGPLVRARGVTRDQAGWGTTWATYLDASKCQQAWYE